MSHHLDLVIKFVCLAITVCDVKGETTVLLQSAIESTIEKAEFVDESGNVDPLYNPCTYTGCDKTSTSAATGPTAMPEPFSGNGADYVGFQKRTRSGTVCQAWSEQSPHAHTCGGKVDGNHRYCRNPDGSSTIWCYTVEPNKRWEYCDPLSHATIILESPTSPCQMLMSEPNCAVSPKYYASGQNYGNSQSCSFKTNKGYKIHSVAFQTERNYDFLNIAGTNFHGENTWDGARYVNGGSDGSAGKSQPITWISDGSVTRSGWKICIVAKIPEHFKMDDHRGGNQQGLRCPLVSAGGAECVTSEGSTYGNYASCTFESVQGEDDTGATSETQGDCDWHYTSHGKVGVEACAEICFQRMWCPRYTYGSKLGCRVSQCGTDPGPSPCPSDKKCPLTSAYGGTAYDVTKRKRLPALLFKYFSTETNFDFLYTDCLSPSSFTTTAARVSDCAWHGSRGIGKSYAGKLHWKTDGSVVMRGWKICMYNTAEHNARMQDRRRRGKSPTAGETAVDIGNAVAMPVLAIADVFTWMGTGIAGWFD